MRRARGLRSARVLIVCPSHRSTCSSDRSTRAIALGVSRPFALVASRGGRATVIPAPNWCGRWRGCCATRAIRPPDGRSSWRKAACPTGRSTTTFPAAWKSSPRPRWRHPARPSPTPSAKHWTARPAPESASAGSSTWPRDRSAGKPAPAARSRRPHSNHPSSALAYAPPQRGASTNGKRSSRPAFGPTAGRKTRSQQTASAALALVEGALLLARVSGQAQSPRKRQARRARPARRASTRGKRPDRSAPGPRRALMRHIVVRSSGPRIGWAWQRCFRRDLCMHRRRVSPKVARGRI